MWSFSIKAKEYLADIVLVKTRTRVLTRTISVKYS